MNVLAVEEAKNDSKNNGTFYNEVEIFDLREENKHLKKELYRLKHTMNKFDSINNIIFNEFFYIIYF